MFLSNGVKRKKEWWETAFNKDYLTADSYFVSRARTKREISFLLRQTEKIGLARNAKILDLACGYGAHAIALAKHGFRVTGIDTSGYFLKIARKSSKKEKQKAQFNQKDMRNLSYQERFDLIISMYTSFGYFSNERDHQKVLREVSRALKPGGAFILDVNNIARVFIQTVGRGMHDTKDNDGVFVEKQLDPATMRWFLDYSWKERGAQKRSKLSIRIFSLPELRHLMEENGLKIKKVWGYYDGSPYQFDSRRLIILARKI